MSIEETPEQKIVRLETENKSLLKDKTTATAAVEKLTSEKSLLSADKETASAALTKLIGEKNAADLALNALKGQHQILNDTHNALVTESTTEIERLSKELSSAKSDASKGILTVTVDSKKYQVIGKKFIIAGKGEMEVEQIIKDKVLLKALVAQGAGFLIATS